MVPGCSPGGAAAALTCPQHGHSSAGSSHSVTNRVIRTSQACAHDEPAILAPSRAVPHREHCAGGSAASCSSGSGSRDKPVPGWPGCPPRLRSLRRSRSETSRFFRSALRRSLAPICSFELGVPELLLSIPRRRSSSAIRSSSLRRSSRSAASSARSIVFSASLASTTARSRASSSRCSPASAGRPGSSGTNPKPAQSQLQLQASASRRVVPTNDGLIPLNGHPFGSEFSGDDDHMANPSKCCTQCGNIKPLSAFHRMATGRDGDRAECADCSCERARRSYKPRDTGLMIIVCLHCGNEFEYVKTSGRRRLYCSDRCKYQAGDATKKQRAAVEIRTCTCGSLDVARVGKPVCPDCRKDPRDSETLRVKERRRTLRLYGLSETGWQELLARQGCRCAICHTADPGGRGQWMIDHDHGCCPGTGSCGQCVRGLLCNQCNLGDYSFIAFWISPLRNSGSRRDGKFSTIP